MRSVRSAARASIIHTSELFAGVSCSQARSYPKRSETAMCSGESSEVENWLEICISSDGGAPAVGGDDGTGEVAGLVRGKERDHAGDLFGVGSPVQQRRFPDRGGPPGRAASAEA